MVSAGIRLIAFCQHVLWTVVHAKQARFAGYAVDLNLWHRLLSPLHQSVVIYGKTAPINCNVQLFRQSNHWRIASTATMHADETTAA